MKNKPRIMIEKLAVWCSYDEILSIHELRPRENNPNKHPQSQVDLLAKIIAEQGWRVPITISRRSGLITRGHGRLLAAQQIGEEFVPVEYQDYDSDESEWADVIADNKIAELSTLDLEAVNEILSTLNFDEFDIDLTGFDSFDNIGHFEPVGETSTDREDNQQGVNSTWGQVNSSNKTTIKMGSIEFSLDKDILLKILTHMQNEFENGISYKESFLSFFKSIIK